LGRKTPQLSNVAKKKATWIGKIKKEKLDLLATVAQNEMAFIDSKDYQRPILSFLGRDVWGLAGLKKKKSFLAI
jgi:hypothetical protein